MKKIRPLKLAFIGGGLSSAVGQVHFNACRLDGNWLLSAGAFSRNPKTNSETATAWNVPLNRTYDNWQQLIEKEKGKIDAVVVLTPTPMHIDILPTLISERIPIICEKAMVSNFTDAEKVQTLTNQHNTFLTVTFNYTGYPMLRELRKRIRNGELGKIQQIQLEMPQEGLVRPPSIAGKAAPPQNWRLKDYSIPTICLDLGVHLHHIAFFLTGEEAISVNAEFRKHSEYNIVDDVMVWARYKSGISASYWMTKTAIGYRNGLRVRIMGNKGSAEWYQQSPETLKLSTIDGTHQIIDRGGQAILASEGRYNRMKVGHPSGFIEAFANLYNDTAEALWEWKENGKFSTPYAFNTKIAVDGLRFFHEARRSHETSNWTEIKLEREQQ